MSNDIPRRARVDLYVPAETAIREAMLAVEAMGADVRLTDAVVLLGKAKDAVADYVDAQPPMPSKLLLSSAGPGVIHVCMSQESSVEVGE